VQLPPQPIVPDVVVANRELQVSDTHDVVQWALSASRAKRPILHRVVQRTTPLFREPNACVESTTSNDTHDNNDHDATDDDDDEQDAIVVAALPMAARRKVRAIHSVSKADLFLNPPPLSTPGCAATITDDDQSYGSLSDDQS
jgi:hypothetical protein